MPRKRLTAAEYLADVDEVMRLMLGEMIQNAADANVHWDTAVRLIGSRPESALEHLVRVWVPLKTAIRVERTDAVRILDRAMELLDKELPDDDVQGPTE
jgi:hypothetical protein